MVAECKLPTTLTCFRSSDLTEVFDCPFVVDTACSKSVLQPKQEVTS